MFFAGSLQSKAQLLGWYFNADNANNGNETSIAAPIIDPNLETSLLTRGAGLGVGTYSRSFMGAFPANAAANRTASLSANTYLQFTLKPKTDKKASLTLLKCKLRTGATSINFGYQWAYSTDNFLSAPIWLGSNLTVTESATSNNEGVFVPDLDLSTVTALQNITSDKTITFRLYIWGSHTVNRNFAIGRSGADTEIPDVVLLVSGGTETLPVNLISFDGKNTSTGVQLNWSTASEKNSDYFDVLHSTDKSNFISIGTKKAQGNIDAKSNYSFTDRNAVNGVNYYILKQIDTDGKSTEYGPIAVTTKNGEDNALKVFYNEESNEVRLTVYSVEKENNTILTISDIEGKNVSKEKLSLKSGVNQLSVSRVLDKGKVYFVSLQTGKSSMSAKFIR